MQLIPISGLGHDLFETVEEKYGYHAVASNVPMGDKSMNEVLEWHNGRGQAENFNKELKSGFGCEQMPCGQTSANAVFFRIGVIAYNLFMGFKMCCPKAWGHQTIATFRWKVMNIAGRIVRHARGVVLRLVADAQTLLHFEGIRRKCFDLSLGT